MTVLHKSLFNLLYTSVTKRFAAHRRSIFTDFHHRCILSVFRPESQCLYSWLARRDVPVNCLAQEHCVLYFILSDLLEIKLTEKAQSAKKTDKKNLEAVKGSLLLQQQPYRTRDLSLTTENFLVWQLKTTREALARSSRACC